MSHLPIDQVSKSQGRPLQMPIQPNTKVVQADLSCQASLKARQSMWSLSCQPKGIEQLVKDRLNQLAQPSQPLTPLFRPVLLAALMRRRNDLGPIQLAPTGMRLLTCKSFVGQVGSLRFGSDTVQPFWGTGTSGQKRLEQRLIVRAGWAKPIAGNDACLCNRGQQVKTFIP